MSSPSSISSLFSPLVFSGVSKYSTDFQSIINRQVQIASLPAQLLTNQDTNLLQGKTLLGSMSTAVSSLGASLANLGKLGESQALVATSSDPDTVAVTAAGNTAASGYTISDITSVAKAASETTLQSYADSTSAPVSTTGDMELDFGGHSYTITLWADANNLTGLRDAINALGAGVTATILTTGSGNYLSVSANAPGATSLRVVDNPHGTAKDILTSSNQGADTVLKLNGIPIRESSATINDVVPGLTFTVKKTTQPSQEVDVSLQTDRSQISSALQDMVTQYNALAGLVSAQIGKSAGVLSGNNIVYQIRSAMMQVVQYQKTGSMGNLANLGIEMDGNGQMSLNQDALNSLSDSQISAAFSLFGSDTSGLGGLQQSFNAISDPITGTIRAQIDQFDVTDQRLQDQVTTISQRVSDMQATLNKKLQAADAVLAALDSQTSILTASIQSLNYTSYGKQDKNS